MSTLLIFILHCCFCKIIRLHWLFLGSLQNMSCSVQCQVCNARDHTATNMQESLLSEHGKFLSLTFIYQGDWEGSRESVTDTWASFKKSGSLCLSQFCYSGVNISSSTTRWEWPSLKYDWECTTSKRFIGHSVIWDSLHIQGRQTTVLNWRLSSTLTVLSCLTNAIPSK